MMEWKHLHINLNPQTTHPYVRRPDVKERSAGSSFQMAPQARSKKGENAMLLKKHSSFLIVLQVQALKNQDRSVKSNRNWFLFLIAPQVLVLKSRDRSVNLKKKIPMILSLFHFPVPVQHPVQQEKNQSADALRRIQIGYRLKIVNVVYILLRQRAMQKQSYRNLPCHLKNNVLCVRKQLTSSRKFSQ